MLRHLAILALLLVAPLAAVADDRPLHGVALVIGESKYEQLPALANPQKDARDIDRLLGDLGFEVDRVLNADGAELRDAIARFIEEAKDADVALVYYSGHGIEAKGENFIAPTDTDLATPQSAGASMIAVQPLLEALSKAAPVTIVLLDACRSDPFPPGQMIVLPGDDAPTPVSGQGLAPVRGPNPVARAAAAPDSLGTVIGFAAEPGEPALDGAPGENSPYAAALLKHFAAGGYSFGDVMTMVTEEVYLKTRAKQLPWTNSSLRRVLTFAAPEEARDPDQAAIKTERRKLLLSIAGTPSETRSYVEALAGQEQVPLDALYGMLDVLGVKPAAGGADLEQQLQKGAERLRQLMAERGTAVRSDPELERLSRLAEEAEAEGAIVLVLKYRDAASARADTLLAGKQAEAERLKQDMADIAQTYADNAAAAVLNFDHLHAAELYGRAYEAVKDWDKAKALDYRINQGDALADHGYYTTDNDALGAALDTYTDALALAPKVSDPAGWAKLEDRIGQAQQMLGARQADAKLLNAALVSYQEALTVRTQAGMPVEWAAAQNNLGNVLFTLGERTQDVPMLEKSVAAFDAALSVYTVEANPVRWATAQSNRASAQMALADAIFAATDGIQVMALRSGAMQEQVENLPEVLAARDQAVALLTSTVEGLENALKLRPKADNPLDWAMIRHTLASVLSDRGKLRASADDVKAAAEAYRDVLTVHDRTRTPVQWSISAANLATTLRQYAGLTKQAAPLGEAAELLTEAIALTPREKSPLDWAELQTKLGNVWADAVDYDGRLDTSDKAIAAYRAALEVDTPEQDLGAWERLQLYIVQIELKTAVPAQDLHRLKDARATAQLASDTLKAHGNGDAAMFEQWLPVLDQFIASLSK